MEPEPDVPKGRFSQSASFDYRRETYISFLTADDSQVIQQARWAPWAGRPTFVVRWGLGAVPSNVPVKISRRQQLQLVSGPPGVKLAALFNERIAAGEFGPWPQNVEPIISGLVWLGIDGKKQLLATAHRQSVDAVALVNVTWAKGHKVQNQVNVVDVESGATVLSGPVLKTTGVYVPKGVISPDAAATFKWVSELMEQVEAKMALKPMPDLTAEDVKQAIEKITGGNRHDLAADLVELRIYRALNLIDQTKAEQAYESLLGSDAAREFIRGDAVTRRRILDKALPDY